MRGEMFKGEDWDESAVRVGVALGVVILSLLVAPVVIDFFWPIFARDF